VKGTPLNIRAYADSDLPRLIELTIATFGPFYEEGFRPLVGDAIFENQHGRWREDYRAQVPALHDPADGKLVAVADDPSGIVGYVGWNYDLERNNGHIEILAVSAAHRGRGIGTRLCEHAFSDLKERGVEVAVIGTGGDDFHAPARALYASLGCTPYPVAVYYRRL